MNPLSKIIFWTSVCFLIFSLAVIFLGPFIPIECTDQAIESEFEWFCFSGIPVAIMVTLAGTIKAGDTSTSVAMKFMATLFIAGATFCVLIIVLFARMCAWTTDEVLFESRQNPSVKIVVRDYGCGATDSSGPLHAQFKITEFAGPFIWVSEVDTNKIDKADWIRINEVR